MANVSSSRLFLQVISDHERVICEVVGFVVITEVVCVFGVLTNILNIMVFIKQGFANTVNISFLGLAIADILSLLSLIWTCTCFNPLLVNSDVPMYVPEIQYITSAIPHFCFARTTMWITAYITAERCLCIMIPLKIKQVITGRRTTIIISIIYCIIVMCFLPEYGATYIDWKFFPERNRTLLGLAFTENSVTLNCFTFAMYSILGLSSFAAVLVFTIVLVFQLKQKSKWRIKANADRSATESISNKETKTVTMVVMIATVLIVCYAPGCVVSVVTFVVPEFSVAGELRNIFLAVWSLVSILDALNSSVNIFLYYTMSSKFRKTFRHIVGLSGIK